MMGSIAARFRHKMRFFVVHIHCLALGARLAVVLLLPRIAWRLASPCPLRPI